MSLFAIDVSAELVRLCRDRYPGSWHLPVEIVRLVQQRGGRAVDVEISSHGLAIGGQEAPVDAGDLPALRALLDPRVDAAVRHEALLALEAGGRLALAALLALPVRAARLQACGVQLEGAGAAWRLTPAPDGSDWRLCLEGLRWDHRRAASWLATACRFAAVAVQLHGVALARGFDDALEEDALPPPLHGRIAVRARGDSPALWLLWHGVLATRGTVPGLPAFDAAIEMAELVPSPDNGAALRDALTPHVPALADAAADLVLRGLERPAPADGVPLSRLRLLRLLLEAVREGVREPEACAAPAIPRVSREGALSWHSIAALRAQARAGEGISALTLPVRAGDPEPAAALAATHAVPASGALLLDARCRSMLAAILGAPLAAPPRRSLAATGRSLRRVLALAREGLHAALRSPGRPLADAELAAPERAARDLLEPLLASSGRTVVMTAGSGPVRRRRGGQLLLPHRSRRSRVLVQALAAAPASAYVAALALLDGDAPADPTARAAWIEGLDDAPRAPMTGD